ncbi:hypothetical protein QMA61_33970 [Streptomyces coelicoflavus]|uniref:hypothetical protein n=1 Tax=Streptomyces coelicoflavus TaxID=285562 RepID=UPI0024AE68F4|nr:hypothetical protein [Streptomyces coelicoflavus]MDI6521192.1 hypothetical protein [Streptomyces coelicoflavus]
MTEKAETYASAQTQERIDKSLTVLKIILLAAIVRSAAGPVTEDFLGDAVIGLPTWEWSLCALTPPALLLLHRSPEKWKLLSYDAIYLQTAAGLYLAYATAFIYFRDGWSLWIAVVASVATFAGVWWLKRREHTHAR